MDRCLFAFLLALLPVALAGGGDAPATPPDPSPAELKRQAERCRHILKTSLIDFYLPACVDPEHGGYFESLRDGKFVATGEKFLVLQARQLWFFSTLAQQGTRKEAALSAAKSGFDFLQNHMSDRRHGGYYAKVSDAGEVKDPRKHVYLNAFALYGLVAYHRASGDDRALAAARDLFRILEEKAHDRRNGGYGEFFTADWQPITDPKEPGYVGAIGTKTYNTHLHVMEALTICIARGPIRSCASAWPSCWSSTRTRRATPITIAISTAGGQTGE